jgi:hypothetical protein
MQESEKNHQPHGPGEFALEDLLFVHRCTSAIGYGRTFRSYKADRDAQACRRTYRGAAHFHQQRLVAWSAQNPFQARLWHSNRLFEHNRTKPDDTRTDRTAYKCVPVPSLPCCSPGGDRFIIFWSHDFFACCPSRTQRRISAERSSLLSTRSTILFSDHYCTMSEVILSDNPRAAICQYEQEVWLAEPLPIWILPSICCPYEMGMLLR